MIIVLILCVALLVHYYENSPKGTFRIEWKFVKEVSLYIVLSKILTVFLIGVRPELLKMINPATLFFVYWEDVVFVITPFLIMSRCKSLKTYIPCLMLFTALTIFFGIFHLYQGPVGLIAILMPWISMEIGRKRGFGTSIMLHILFDILSYSIYYGWYKLFQ